MSQILEIEILETEILYILTQQGLMTMACTVDSLTLLDTFPFDANLNAGLVLEASQTVLYAVSITHGGFYVFDSRERHSPKLKRTFQDKFYPVDGTRLIQIFS